MIKNKPTSCRSIRYAIRGRILLCGLVLYCLLGTSASPLQAGYIYPLQIFTNNGSFSDSPDLNLYAEVTDPATGQVDFTFHNESLVNSCISEIYFEDGLLLGSADITEGPETLFHYSAKPKNPPGCNMLEPLFVTTEGLSFDSEPAPPKNGINPGEWVRITFDLENGGTFETVINELNTGALRIAAHIIALPDGSSESAVTVPEPATICLLGLGSLVLLRRRRSTAL
jgi:hypothetical protein